MKIDLLTSDELYYLKEDLLEAIRQLFEIHGTPKRKWLRSQDVQDLLCISAGTLHNLREKGILPYSKIEGVILYEYDDIVEVIRKNKV
ncbi:MAG: helix-turn-helix domain-containing protein [Bacteroidota bacterium]